MLGFVDMRLAYPDAETMPESAENARSRRHTFVMNIVACLGVG